MKSSTASRKVAIGVCGRRYPSCDFSRGMILTPKLDSAGGRTTIHCLTIGSSSTITSQWSRGPMNQKHLSNFGVLRTVSKKNYEVKKSSMRLQIIERVHLSQNMLGTVIFIVTSKKIKTAAIAFSRPAVCRNSEMRFQAFQKTSSAA